MDGCNFSDKDGLDFSFIWVHDRADCYSGIWGPFLERPGNLTGQKSDFEIKISRKVGGVLNSNKVHFVSLANSFTVQYSKLLKLPSGMENKTA